LIVGVLIKQTALLVVPVVVIYSLKRFGPRRTLISGSFGVLMAFFVVAPLILLGYHPATIYQSIVSQVLNFATPTPVNASADTFSVWTLVDGLKGLHGFSRIWGPFPPQVFGISYSTLGSLLFFVVTV